MMRAVDESPFVGRVEELRRVLAAWEVAAVGGSALAVIRGEPGVGKSALADAAAARVRAAGGLVLRGRCDDGAALPYQPFVEILRALAATAPAVLPPPGPAADALAQLVPELWPDRAEQELAPERPLLLRAVSSTLQRAADDQPLLVVLDDLQWSTPATLLLLRHLVRDIALRSVLVMALHRTTELDRTHPLLEILSTAGAPRRIERVTLGGLSLEEVRELLEQCGAPVAGGAAELRDRTSGNPFFLRELLTWPADRGPIPESVREVVAARVDRLADPARRLVERLAVRSRTSPPAVLEHLAGASDGDALDALDAAIAAGLLREEPSGGIAFVHDLVREAVYDSAGPLRRARLHREVATALEQLDSDGSLAAEVAHHLDAGGAGGRQHERMVRAAVRAAAYALDRYEPEAAASLLGPALDRPGAIDARLRCDGLLLAARAELRVGDAARARERSAEAVALARDQGDGQRLALAVLVHEEAAWTGEGFVVEPAADGMAELLHEAIDGLGEADPTLRGRLLARLPRVLCFKVGPEDRRPYADEAAALAEQTGSAVLRGEALEARRWALWGGPDVEQALAVSEQMVVAASRTEDGLLLTRAHIWRYLAELERPDLGAAASTLDALGELGERFKDPMARWFPPMGRSALALLAGDLAAAEQLAFGALAVAQDLGLQWAITNFGIQLAYVRREQGRLGELEEATVAVAERFDAPVWQAALADLYCTTGNLTEARAPFEHLAAQGFADVPRDPGWLVTMTVLADVCAALGDSERAVLLYDLLQPHAARTIVVGPGVVVSGSASRPAGRLAALLGRHDDAARHLAEAIRWATDAGAPLALAHAQGALAEAEARRSDSPPSV